MYAATGLGKVAVTVGGQGSKLFAPRKAKAKVAAARGVVSRGTKKLSLFRRLKVAAQKTSATKSRGLAVAAGLRSNAAVLVANIAAKKPQTAAERARTIAISRKAAAASATAAVAAANRAATAAHGSVVRATSNPGFHSVAKKAVSKASAAKVAATRAVKLASVVASSTDASAAAKAAAAAMADEAAAHEAAADADEIDAATEEAGEGEPESGPNLLLIAVGVMAVGGVAYLLLRRHTTVVVRPNRRRRVRSNTRGGVRRLTGGKLRGRLTDADREMWVRVDNGELHRLWKSSHQRLGTFIRENRVQIDRMIRDAIEHPKSGS